MSVRDKIVELAKFYEDTSPAHRKEDYLDLLTRGGQESPEVARDMLHMSSCALAVRGFWYKAGIRHKRLVERYQMQMAPRDVLEVARSFGAARTGSQLGTMPPVTDDNPYIDPYSLQPGDSYYVLYPSDGKGEHFGTIIEVTKATSATLEIVSIDGGQTNGGIMRVHSLFQKRGSNWVNARNGKALAYWFDADKLIATA